MTAKYRRNLILVVAAAMLLVAFFTNPNQAAHFQTIKDTVELRHPDSKSTMADMLLPGANTITISCSQL